MSDLGNLQKYWHAFEYFQTSKDECPVLAERRKEWPNYLAKRLTNDYKAVLNKEKIQDFFIIDPESFAFFTFLYWGRIYTKKEYLDSLTNVVKWEHSLIKDESALDTDWM